MPLDPARERLVAMVTRDCASPQNITYGEVRPTPVARYKDGRWPIVTDCSGWYQCLCYAAGLPDPFGTGYAGAGAGGCEGYTGSALSHLKPIPLGQVVPGDCVVFGAYPGRHLAVFLTTGTAAHVEVGSNGQPADPVRVSLAAEAAGFQGQAITYLQLPAPGIVQDTWQVRDLRGTLLGTTHHPVRWALRHPRSFRRHAEVSFHKEVQQ